MKQPKQPDETWQLLKWYIIIIFLIVLGFFLNSCKTVRHTQKDKQQVDSTAHVKTDSTGFHSLDTASVKKEEKEWSNVLEIEYDNAEIEQTPIDPKDYTSILPKIKGPIKKVTIRSKGKEVLMDSSHKQETKAASVKSDSKTDVSKQTKVVDRQVKKPSIIPWLAGLIVFVLLVVFLWIRRKKKQLTDFL